MGLVGAGAVALTLGAVAGFFGQQAGTTKELVEEGIDPRARLRLLPVAVSAAAACRRCLPPACILLQASTFAVASLNSVRLYSHQSCWHPQLAQPPQPPTG